MLIRLFKNQYVSSLLTKGILVIVGIINSVLINRYLGPTLKGEYAYILNIINIVVLILNFGIYQSYPNFKKRLYLDVQNKYFNLFVFQFLIYICVGFVASIMVGSYSLSIILTLVPFMVLTKQLTFVAMIENFNLRNIIILGNEIIYTLSLFVVFLWVPKSYHYLLVLLYLKDIVTISVILIKFKFRVKLNKLDTGLLISSLKYGIFPMLSMLLITANYKIDIILLRWFVDFEQIGYYTVGVGLANQLWIIPDAFKDVLFSRSAKNDSKKDIIIGIKINIFISIIILFVISNFGELIISFLYGVEFIEAYSVTVIIFIGIIPMILFKLINVDFVVNGKQKLSFVLLLISVVLNTLANLLLIPVFGIIGAAYASVLSYSVCGILFLLIFMNNYQISIKNIVFISNEEIDRIKSLYKNRIEG